MITLGVMAGLGTASCVGVVSRTEGLSLRPLTILAFGIFTFAAVWLIAPANLALVPIVFTTALLALSVALAVSDAVSLTVPDWLTFTFIGLGLVNCLALGAPLAPHAVGAAALVLWALAQGAFTQDDGWIGSGDLLLFAGTIAWFGPLLSVDVLAVACFLMLLQTVVRRGKQQPFAPALALAQAIIWFGGPIL